MRLYLEYSCGAADPAADLISPYELTSGIRDPRRRASPVAPASRKPGPNEPTSQPASSPRAAVHAHSGIDPSYRDTTSRVTFPPISELRACGIRRPQTSGWSPWFRTGADRCPGGRHSCETYMSNSRASYSPSTAGVVPRAADRTSP